MNITPVLPYFLSLLSGYLVGSFPTGYLLVKQRSNIDITKSGSGNVGAYNASVVTGSNRMGIAVGVIDGMKGLIAVLIGSLWSPDFPVLAISLVGSVIGHNYPVWLRFKGGRGLATACGGLLLLATGYVIVWCTIWVVLKWQKQTILVSNLVATFAAPVVVLLLPGTSLEAITALHADATEIRLLGAAISVILLLSHLDAFEELKPKKGE